MRKKILIVNVFFDEFRRSGGSPWRVPRGSGHIFLAGAFNPATTELRVYSEQTEGYLLNSELLAWPDMLVLTGLTSGFDRMLHLAAYARTLNPRVINVAGGPAIRALPKFAAGFFDRICLGDVEDLRDVAISYWGEHIAAPPGQLLPRFDLAPTRSLVGYVESSRYCNFKCSFCSLTGERRLYRKYDLDHIRRQIQACGKRQIIFLDNNFYGSDRQFFLDRLDMLSDLRRHGTIDGWHALVTGDFFARGANLDAAARAGCISLFSGVESFDDGQLAAFNKRQNKAGRQVEMIRACLESGILFQYGVMLDPSTRAIQDLEDEIDFILSKPEITLPAYFTLPIPLLGTPFFAECLQARRILPNLHLRDMNGVSLLLKPCDPLDKAVGFAKALVDLRGRRRRVLCHAARFAARYVRRLSPLQHTIAASNAVLTTIPRIATAPLRPHLQSTCMSYFGPTEPIDRAYTPAFPIGAELRRYFRPTVVTDCSGRIAPELSADLVSVGPAKISADGGNKTL